MTEAEAYIALNLLPGIGPLRVRRLLETFQSPQTILNTSAAQLQRVDGIGRELAETLSHWENKVDLGNELNQAKALNITIITLADSNYPENLRNLYEKGNGSLRINGMIETMTKQQIQRGRENGRTYSGCGR